MEVIDENNQCCFGCLCIEDEYALQPFTIQCEPLKAAFQMGTITLCYLCKRIAQHTQIFIQNVLSNQILMQNFHGNHSSIQSVRAQVQPWMILARGTLPSMQLSGTGLEESYCIISNNDLKIKLELKEEESEYLEGEFIDGCDDFQHSSVKEEDFLPNNLLKEEIVLDSIGLKSLRKTLKKNRSKKKDGRIEKKLIKTNKNSSSSKIVKEDFPPNNMLKEEIELDSIDLKSLRKKLKKNRSKKIDGRIEKKLIKISKHSSSHRKIILVKNEKSKAYEKSLVTESSSNNYAVMHITEKQCEKEREQRAKDEAYQNSVHKCKDCVKGFMLKNTYDRHMEKHSLSSGSFRCTICKQRFQSVQKLATHRRCHTLRYKCPECDLTRVSHNAIKIHFATKHSSTFGSCEYKCPHCPKVFKLKTSLRKHELYTHSQRGRVTCETCNKTFVNKDSLLQHLLRKHPTEGVSDSFRKRYMCQECGIGFKAPSQLRNHSVMHSDLRAFYCVECDRSFKTAAILTHHLKTTTPHINYSELPLSCQHCDKRFAIKRDLERHTNRVHLNIKPYPCDKCNRAYINSWSLREHKKYNHEGAKRPLRYPCSLCDKIFDRNSILKSHLRTHTGERPYHCELCPARFAQGSALGTHVNLVHLKLTRDGRPITIRSNAAGQDARTSNDAAKYQHSVNTFCESRVGLVGASTSEPKVVDSNPVVHQ